MCIRDSSSDIIRDLLNDNSENELEEIKRLWLRLGDEHRYEVAVERLTYNGLVSWVESGPPRRP